MYVKLALGNVRKSIRDFSVFFLTLAFGVCVFYAFGSITDQTAVLDMRQDQREVVEALMGILGGVSVFVVIILGFLVVYANRFLIRRRKREFGIYLTLGMGLSRVSLVIVVETLVVGVVARGVGLLLGVCLSQLMMYMTARFFELTISSFTFMFSTEACTSTVLCFAGIFLVSMAFNVTTVSRYKLIDLINADRVSEKVKVRSLPVSAALFVVSVAVIAVSYKVLLEHGMLEEGPYFSVATGLVTVGTLLFFFSISGFLLRLVQSSKGLYLRGLNMFVLRQLNSRINTAWLSVSMVCAMLFLAICGVCTGFSVATNMNEAVLTGTPYDASMVSYPTGRSLDYREGPAVDDGYDALAALRRDIPEFDELVSAGAQVDFRSEGIDEEPALTLAWFAENTDFNGSALVSQLVSGADGAGTEVMYVAVSQVNALRTLTGEAPLELGENECLVWSDMTSMNDFWRAATAQNPTVTVWGRELTFASTDPVETIVGDTPAGSSVSGALIVPDDVIPADARHNASYVNVMYNGSREEVEPRWQEAVERAYGDVLGTQDQGVFPWPIFSMMTASEILSQSGGITLTTTYLAIYIGFVLLVSCASVLALQQLSEAADNLGRYRVLAELGAEPRMISRALLAQIGVYFVFPLVVAIAHASVALYVVSDIVVVITGYDIGGALAATVAFVVALYGGYFAVTYLTSKGMLLRSGLRS